MATRITTGRVHHLRLTVSDIARARAFYTGVLGFNVAVELPPGVLLTNGDILLGLGPAPNPDSAISGERFDENRVGPNPLSLSVASMHDLQETARILDENGVERGEIKDLGPDFGIAILAFRDPDNIQLELTAPRE